MRTIYITETHFTWAPCQLFVQHSVQGAAEELTGPSVALLRHPVHHLGDSPHAGGFTRHHLKQRRSLV